MKRPVIAIGLDSAEPRLLETWMDKGYLKNLSHLREQGAYGRLNNTIDYAFSSDEQSATEASWTAFLTGCAVTKNGYWGTIKYHPERYETSKNQQYGSYHFQEYPIFYALGDNYKVLSFDVPTAVKAENVNGIQIKNWGGHFPFSSGWSEPPEIFPKIIERYGENAVLNKDHGYWWNQSYIDDLKVRIKSSITTRAKICQDLLKQQSWDLFLTNFVDIHSAGHSFWHLSEETRHPLYPYKGQPGSDPLLESFQDVDTAIGEILSVVPEDAYVICFAVHGMGNNVTDLSSMAFLPELMYRFNFPGHIGIAPGQQGTLPSVITQPLGKGWSGIVWRNKYEQNPIKQFIRKFTPSKYLKADPQSGWISPYELDQQKHPLSRMPAQWCSPLWPEMKIFAIPSFSDGHLRINLQGRDPQGVVEPGDYEALCKQVTEILYALKDARTGDTVVDKVVRTRKSPSDLDHPSLPDADLIVKWTENKPADVIDSPHLGRLGPLPFYRSGGHRSDGFVLAKGPGITGGLKVKDGSILDLSPTILNWMGAPIPDYFDGKPLL